MMMIDMQIFRYMLYGKFLQYLKRKPLVNTAEYEKLKAALKDYRPNPKLRNIPFEEQTFTVFDLETTGFFPDFGHEIISFGAIKITGNDMQQSETFYRLAKPLLKVPKKIIKLTNLNPDEVAQAPSFLEVMREFHEFSKDTILVAHPASFDIRFIQTMLKAWKLPPFACYTLDSQIMANMFFKRRQSRLDALIKRFNIQNRQRHHALDDAAMTAEIFQQLLEMAAEKGFHSYADLQIPLSQIKRQIRASYN